MGYLILMGYLVEKFKIHLNLFDFNGIFKKKNYKLFKIILKFVNFFLFLDKIFVKFFCKYLFKK